MSAPLLEVEGLAVRWGAARAVDGLGFRLEPGAILMLLGRNGAGKSSTLKGLMGLAPAEGRILLDGRPLDGLAPDRRARAGLGWVPEDRRVFADLSVAENLATGRLPPRPGLPTWDAAALTALFPPLAPLMARRAGTLSGGEQQMLTIARTLMGHPLVLLLDEPSEGLAPVIVQALARALASLAEAGMALVVAEHNAAFAARLGGGRGAGALVLESGRPAWQGPLEALAADRALEQRLLGV